MPKGIQRAKFIYEEIDNELSKHDTSTTSCLKGCASCCHFNVDISDEEAELLASLVLDGEIPIDRERLALQAGLTKGKNQWPPTPCIESRCVFLGKDKICRIYEHRPLACRKCFVTSDPQECATASSPALTPMIIPEVEILASIAVCVSSGTKIVTKTRTKSKRLTLFLHQ